VLTSQQVLELCFEHGFDLAGIAPLRAPAAAERFRAWLAAGHHAELRWLERNAERITDPARVLPGGRSLLVVGLGHARAAVELPGGGRIARYAAGRDYHNWIGKRLRRLAAALRERGALAPQRTVVDAGPLLERSHAAEAGLGFESKAANLIHRRLGPWFFLGEVLLREELEPTVPGPALGSCGTCRACLDACPTGAIRAPGVVDAGACISYQTIEQRGPVPAALRPQLGPWAFGCDVCSEVCPYGRRAPDRAALFGTHRAVEGGSLQRWLAVPEAEFAARFEGSPLRRPGRVGLARNAALALGNGPQEGGAEALGAALLDPSPVVREAAGWALGRGYGRDRGVAQRLAAAARRESDPAARAGLEAAAGELPEPRS
jgi:epoxyqueuosine reductase